jgi:hypothetical protein
MHYAAMVDVEDTDDIDDLDRSSLHLSLTQPIVFINHRVLRRSVTAPLLLDPSTWDLDPRTVCRPPPLT